MALFRKSAPWPDTIDIAGRPVTLTVREHARSRRYTLRLDPATDGVRLTVPTGSRQGPALRFMEERADWIRDRLQELGDRIPLSPGATIPYRGMPHLIVHDAGAPRRVVCEDQTLRVGGPVDHVPARLERWLKRQARTVLTERAHEKAAEINRAVRSLSLRDTRSRWGSCSSSGGLNFSWRIILAPDSVLDYLVAHEVAHLAHMNHGDRFWALVATLTAEPRAGRRWLRTEGRGLHRIG